MDLDNGDVTDNGNGPAIEQTKTKDSSRSATARMNMLASSRNKKASTSNHQFKVKIKKLQPQRPFPTVPTSVSATGPRSAHAEGKNYICVSRKTPLGAYLRRCKEAIIKDGHKTLHLSAMGAAIPHLLLLSTSLPSILPFAADEIHTEVRTGTVEVQDEVIPDDEDEDITYRTRGKSSLSIVIKIGKGDDEGGPSNIDKGREKGMSGSHKRQKRRKAKSGQAIPQPVPGSEQVPFQEPEQDDMSIS